MLYQIVDKSKREKHYYVFFTMHTNHWINLIIDIEIGHSM